MRTSQSSGTGSPTLAYAAVSFGHLFHTEEADAAAGRLAAFLDGYAPLGQTADYAAQHEHIWRRATGHCPLCG